MLLEVGSSLESDPLGHASWARLWLSEVQGVLEIAVTGSEAATFAREINTGYWGQYVLMASTQPDDKYPMLVNRWQEKETLIYVCRDNVCKRPVRRVEDMYLVM